MAHSDANSGEWLHPHQSPYNSAHQRLGGLVSGWPDRFCSPATLADLDFFHFSLRTPISLGERLPRSFMRD